MPVANVLWITKKSGILTLINGRERMNEQLISYVPRMLSLMVSSYNTIYWQLNKNEL